MTFDEFESITHELRKWANIEVPYKYGHQLTAIADRIDAEHERQLEVVAHRHVKPDTWEHIINDVFGSTTMNDEVRASFVARCKALAGEESVLVEVAIPLECIGSVRCDFDGFYHVQVLGEEVDTDEETYLRVVEARARHACERRLTDENDNHHL